MAGVVGALLLLIPFSTHAASVSVSHSAVLPVESYHIAHKEIGGVDYLFVAAGESGLLIYSATDSGITLVGQYDSSGTALDVVVSGDYAYVADGNTTTGFISRGHVLIINITNPALPSVTGDYYTQAAGSSFRTVDVVGTTLYAGHLTTGLHIVNVSNPAAPTLLSTYADGAGANDILVDNNRAYIMQAALGFVSILDVSNGLSPTLLGYTITDTTGNELYVDGNTLFVADGEYGLSVYDVTDPSETAIQLLGVYNTPGAVSTFVPSGVYNSIALIPDGAGGIQIVNTADLAAITAIASTSEQTYEFSVDAVAVGDAFYVITATSLHEVKLKLNLTVTGSAAGKTGVVTVYDGSTVWKEWTAYDSGIGAQAILKDLNKDGAYEVITAPVSKAKKPKLIVWDAVSGTKLSSKALSDSDSKKAFVIAADNYYSGNSQREVVAVEAFKNSDNIAIMNLLSFFVNTTDFKIKQKAKIQENPTLTQFSTEGVKVVFKLDKSYPVIVQAKSSSDKKVKYQLKKKSDGSFVWKKKTE